VYREVSMDEPDVDRDSESLFDVEQKIEQAIKAYDAEAGGGNALLMGWVVVAEWVDDDGDPNLTAFARERMPYWRIDALLQAGKDEILYQDEDEWIDDDD
jgi:hypothetical protein